MVIIDTAGRLHTKTGLMDELGKVKRVIERQAPVGEVLSVPPATTGQNGLTQARIFAEVVQITGIVLTKLDGTAKGGIVIAGAARARRTGEARRARRGRGRPGPLRRRGVRRRPAGAGGLAVLPERVLGPDRTTGLRGRAGHLAAGCRLG